MLHVLHRQMTLNLPGGEVFAFFADAENLERITPPELHFRIISPRPVPVSKGTIIDYRLRLFHIPFGWRTRITRWRPPHHFVDEQIKGPYRLWIHSHQFREENGTTRIIDRVEYQLPWYPFGECFHPWVKLELDRIFHYRRQAIRNLLETEPSRPRVNASSPRHEF